MAKKSQEDPLKELEKAYAHWQALYNYGGSDPTWPDGVNLNLVRGHITVYKRQIEEDCPLYMSHELYQRPLPPKVDDNYMARADFYLDSFKDCADKVRQALADEVPHLFEPIPICVKADLCPGEIFNPIKTVDLKIRNEALQNLV